MSADAFFQRLKAVTGLAVDVDGVAIKELDGYLLKPLDVEDMLAVSGHVDKYGKDKAYQMVFARGLREQDGTQVIPDERAGELVKCLNGPISRAIAKIRTMGGHSDEEVIVPGEEKKTTSTNEKT